MIRKRGISMPGKRHSQEEVASKLQFSDVLVAAGKLQSEIAKELGVSLMTYHRWRKARRDPPLETVNGKDPMVPQRKVKQQNGKRNLEFGARDLPENITQLHLENSRLRRLVTDLLLETDRLEGILTDLPGSRAVVTKARKRGFLQGSRRLESVASKVR
jgi:putative transposase